MTRQTPFIYSLFCSLLIISISCKKASETYPEVKIVSPFDGANYAFGDTIRLEVEVTNSNSNLIVNVLDNGQNIGLNYSQLYLNGNIQAYEIYFNNKYVESGKYSIKVSASNGGNTSSDFKAIYLNELPLKRIGLVALTYNASSSFISIIDSMGNSEESTLSGDIGFLEYSNSQSRAFLAPVTQGKLSGYSVFPLEEEFVIKQSSSGGTTLYNDLVDDGKYVFSLGGNGEVKAYDSNGSVVRSFNINPTLEPLTGCYGEEGLLVSVKERGKENYFLQLLNPVNGAVLKNIALLGEAIDMVWVTKDLFAIAVSKSGQTLGFNYVPSTNTLTQTFSLPSEPICMAIGGSSLALVSTVTDVYLVNAQSGGLPSLVYNFSASDMECDLSSQDVFLSNGSKVYRGDWSGGIKQTFQYPNRVQQFELVYNK